ncbi:glycoside hydrolase family 47 protein [Sphingomonas ginkgonis]|uniref:Glycoside hydrolase family 47 protein n=1 Tax=Sphingomonas ginkgonis TaxID=2315330 RepID=A0A429V9Z2_9SPHN|nr:glycoside hydrolase family 47 protein [Sphingomonas ginkgonis]RST30682.1 glycoside hydrolase family 47 protein [Sphingomonas ginkgonis]
MNPDNRPLRRLGRRDLLRGSAAALAASAAAPLDAAVPRGGGWKALGDDVRSEMAWAWDKYREHAWGKDEIKPVSGAVSSFPLKHHHLGLTLIEALDTLWVMGLDSRFADGVAWVKREANFAVDGEVSVFETSIRLVGGLLSAHHASGDPALLALARDLADRLLPAFDTPTGFPYRYINLKTRAVRDPATNPAEIGSFLPEWGTLSRLTGDPRYHDFTRRAMVRLFERRSRLDLLAVKIDARTGEWLDRRATVGSYADSYYEYLWDSWQLFGDAECRRMYEVCTAAILRHQKVWKDGRLWIADVDFETGKVVSTEQDELASFYGGLLAQGGHCAEGAALTMSWSALQDRFGVLPEGYDYASGKPTAVGNALRPELADSAFNLWLLDRQPRWREIAWRHFAAMRRWNKARYGYTDLADITSDPKRQADHCPGYWWSEQMKYYYLLFSDTPRFDYSRNYLSTEGDVLLGFRHGR